MFRPPPPAQFLGVSAVEEILEVVDSPGPIRYIWNKKIRSIFNQRNKGYGTMKGIFYLKKKIADLLRYVFKFTLFLQNFSRDKNW